jgi:hypothetical protein
MGFGMNNRLGYGGMPTGDHSGYHESHSPRFGQQRQLGIDDHRRGRTDIVPTNPGRAPIALSNASGDQRAPLALPPGGN